jgi:hypothetical protein
MGVDILAWEFDMMQWQLRAVSKAANTASKAIIVTIGLWGLSVGMGSVAIAQVTINSSGIVAGTVTPPNRNPTFNQGTTRVDTDSQGRYFRNGTLLFDASTINPNLVGVDARGRYYVDFRGIPVVSTDGSLTSPAFINGQLDAVQRFNNDELVKFWGNIQDEFVVQGRYTGVAVDAAGNQYQGTFAIRGQGPRYSATNGGSSPTVFDFKSYYNTQATPPIPSQTTVFSYPITAMPVNLTITVPAGTVPLAQPIVPSPPSNVPPSNVPPSNLPPSNVPPVIGTTPPPVDTAGLNSTMLFEVNPVLLKPVPKRVGPRSRVIVR